MTPTFSTHWLIPNLQSFREKHPEIALSISALTTPADFTSLKYDAAIMREDFCNPWPDFEYLFEEELVPVCSRMLWRDDSIKLTTSRAGRVYSAASDHPPRCRSDWFQLSGIHNPKPGRPAL